MPIDTREQLHDHIREAIGIELTVFPAYLYAMYSLADRASDAEKMLRSVAAEEMLHVMLWTNLLLATGGDITFCSPTTMPAFPASLTHRRPVLTVNLEPYSEALIEKVFMPIEAPAPAGAPAEPDIWETVGQFFAGIWEGLARLDAKGDLFADPQLARQFSDPHGYMVPKFDAGDSGGLIVVSDLASAEQALETIVHQGEGVADHRYADPGHAELTHYAKFVELPHAEILRSGVLPAMVNPTVDSLPASIAPVAAFSDALTTYIYLVMDRLLSPQTEEHHHQVSLLYGTMVALLAPVARYLMTLQVDGQQVAGPPFGYFEFSSASTPEDQLRSMAAALAPDHPALQTAFDLLHRLPTGDDTRVAV
jgi:hypothetical protein